MTTASPTSKSLLQTPLRLLSLTITGAVYLWILPSMFSSDLVRGVTELIGALVFAAGASGLLLCGMTRAMQWLMRA